MKSADVFIVTAVFLPQVVEEVSAITLTAVDTAVHLRATQMSPAACGQPARSAGEEWLLTATTTTSYIPPIGVVCAHLLIGFILHVAHLFCVVVYWICFPWYAF